MRQTEEALKRCESCGYMNRPGDEEWLEQEKFRNEFGDDPRVIYGLVEPIDYCPSCAKLFHTDEDFGSSDDRDEDNSSDPADSA